VGNGDKREKISQLREIFCIKSCGDWEGRRGKNGGETRQQVDKWVKDSLLRHRPITVFSLKITGFSRDLSSGIQGLKRSNQEV